MFTGIALLVASVFLATTMTAVAAVQLTDMAIHSTAIPAMSQWIAASNVKAGKNYIWSTTGELPKSCEVMKGDPADNNPIKLEPADITITLPDNIDLKPVGQFEATGSQVAIRCENADQSGKVAVLYVTPGVSPGLLVGVIFGAIGSSMLFLIGVALIVVQTLRRAAWNNRHLRAIGVI